MVRRDPGKESVKPNHRAAPPEGDPPAAFFVQMGGKLKKRLADMSEKSEITGNPDENWYTGDV